MAKIEFSDIEKATIVSKIKLYFREELDQDIAQFDAEFLLAFFTVEVGAYHYYRGLGDAMLILEQNLESMSDAFHELYNPTDFIR